LYSPYPIPPRAKQQISQCNPIAPEMIVQDERGNEILDFGYVQVVQAGNAIKHTEAWHSMFRIFPEPNNYPGSPAIDVLYQADLFSLFYFVLLIDTDRINPKAQRRRKLIS
jgi:hypothetical protein